MILAEHGQDLGGVEPVHIVYEGCRFAEPLTVQLAPHGLGPAGIGNGVVETVRVHAVPVLGGMEVTQRIFVVVQCHLGIAGGAGGKERQQGIIAAGRVFPSFVMAAVQAVFGVEVVPAFSLYRAVFSGRTAVDQNPDHGLAVFFQCLVGLCGSFAVCGTQNGGNTGGFKTVGKVVNQQLVGGGDGNGTDLVQTDHSQPVLPVPLEHQHNPVALLDTQRLEVVGASGGTVHDVTEGEAAFAHVVAHVLHGQSVRLFLPHGVHQVKGKVELVGVPEPDVGGRAVFVLGHGDEPAVDPFGLGFAQTAGSLDLFGTGDGEFFHRCAGGVENDGVENAASAVHCDHTVGDGGVVVNGVPGVEDLLVFTDLDLQSPFDDDIEFLPFVGGHFDILSGGFFIVFHFHVQRLGDTVLEGGRHVVVGHPVGVVDLLSFALSGDGVAGQGGGLPFDDIGYVNAQRQCAAVNKRKVQVIQTRFAGDVFCFGHACLGCHFGGGISFDLTQIPDTCRHFLDLELQAGDLCFHIVFLSFFPERSFNIQKSSSQRISRCNRFFLETNLRKSYSPRYHSNCAASRRTPLRLRQALCVYAAVTEGF